LKKQGDRLYERVKEFEEQWFASQVMPKIRKLITSNLINITQGGIASITANERRLTGEAFLTGMKASWGDHITVMNMTTDVLMYMDRVYCTDNRKASIFTTAMGLFRDHIIRSSLSDVQMRTCDVLNSVILDQIGMERDGDVINKALVRNCMSMLEGLYATDEEVDSDKLYLTMFEPEFLDKSRLFYNKECNSLLRDSDASTWLRQTRRRLEEEAARCQTTVSPLTAPKIAKVVEEEMISAHLSEFLQMEGSGIKAMINNDRFEDLDVLYQLISRVDATKAPLKKALQSQVVDLGTQINKTIIETDFTVVALEDGEAADAPVEVAAAKSKAPPKKSVTNAQTLAAIKWVEEVLRLKDKFDTMWGKCFDQDLQLQTALTKSFADFINLFDRSSEYVSLFIDENLKRGIKGKTEAEIDEVLDKAVTLIRYIQDKDIFERYYKKHLARRLLMSKSESADVEKAMITRMKMEIGNAFTQKLEGMFKDMQVSTELTSQYRDHMRDFEDTDRKIVDLGIQVLTTNHWPVEAVDPSSKREEGRENCTWPPQISTLQESFKSFYLKERNGRRLTWLPFLGNADIKIVFPKVPGKEVGPLSKVRRHEFNCSTYAMIILLQFNDLEDGASLTFEEIQEATNLSSQELSKQLFTLSVLPKAKVLSKTPDDRALPKAGDKFSFNTSFNSKAIKIKQPIIQGLMNKVESEEERKETEEKNDEHRGFIIDTVIVRIMK
jgi:cullin 3